MRILLAVLLLSFDFPARAAPATLCHPGETSYFSCTMRAAHKIASLCAHEAEPRYLQYRFGRAGQVPELQVPARLDDPQMGSTFFYDGSRRADGGLDSWAVWFRNADAIYELEYVDTRDPGPPEYADILLWTSARQEVPRGLACTSAAGAKGMREVDDLIRAMSPPGRSEMGSAWDEQVKRQRAAGVGR